MKILFNLAILLFFTINTALAKGEKFKIGTSSILESNYIIGLEICNYLNNSNYSDCELVPTKGSIESLEMLNKGALDFALVQANFALDAKEGKGYFMNNKIDDLIQVLRLYDSIFSVLVKDKDLLLVFGDLEAKKITNGSDFSDSAATYNQLAGLYNFKKAPEDLELSVETYANKFCASEVDAIVLMTAHPSHLINFITHQCESDFLTIELDKIDTLIAENPAYQKVILPRSSYKGITKAEVTIATPVLLVSTKKTKPEVIEKFLSYFQQKISSFTLTYPPLRHLDEEHFLEQKIIQN